VNGTVVAKPASQISGDQALAVAAPASGEPEYASRGGRKLAGALDALEIQDGTLPIPGAFALDAGASAGGFTDVLLRRGAAHVTAVDVGYGQLDWRLRTDPRVSVRDRTNVRHLARGDIEPPPSLVVGDLSFISLTSVLAALRAVATVQAHFFLLVKPQFEVGRAALPAGGVVRDPDHRAGAVAKVVGAAGELGLRLHHVVRSPLPGPSGNVEFFIHLACDAAGALDDEQTRAAVLRETRDGSGVAA
jgi:23S rRNA (cytidine1920-2'-O)/16S rRNA (cytidine1409-2'-O)-methyltransferase